MSGFESRCCLWRGCEAVNFILLCLVLIIIQGCSSRGLDVGNKIPDLMFSDAGGNKVHVYDFIKPGKILLIHVWGGMCCSYDALPTLKAVSVIASNSSLAASVEVISVNLEHSKARIAEITKGMKTACPIFSDRTTSSFSRNQPKGQCNFSRKVLYAVDGNGIIRRKLEGNQSESAIRELLRSAAVGNH